MPSMSQSCVIVVALCHLSLAFHVLQTTFNIETLTRIECPHQPSPHIERHISFTFHGGKSSKDLELQQYNVGSMTCVTGT
jgi:hypothetical protein